MTYIFFTGAPGSRWSGVSQVFRNALDNVDNSDVSESRTYSHHLYNGHVGNYYGPGLEYGTWLDQALGSREQWEAEIARSYTDHSKPVKLIMSHNFAYYLDQLVETFPESKIVLCYRNSKHCFDWWHTAGGWNISHPNYHWYRNDAKMRREIRSQNRAILKFAEKHDLELAQPGQDFFRQHFDIDRDFIFDKDVSVAVYG